MKFVMSLSSNDLFNIKIKVPEHLNLFSSAKVGNVPDLTKPPSDIMAREFYKDEKDAGIRNTIIALNLEYKSETFLTTYFNNVSLGALHLHPSELKHLMRKDSTLPWHVWNGHIMEELLLKTKWSREALSSALNVIDKVDYCRYLPCEVIFENFKKYLKAALSKRNESFEVLNQTRDRLILDVVNVFIKRRDVFLLFMFRCPIDLERFLMIAQIEKFHVWDLWKIAKLYEDEASHMCLIHNAENSLVFFKYGGQSKFSMKAFNDLRDHFIQDISFIVSEADLKVLFTFLDDGYHKRMKFRVLQVMCLYFLRFDQDSINALKWLWGCVEDPFLIDMDVSLFYVYIQNSDLRVRLARGYAWYNLLIGRRAVRQPRSLKHLSRCGVRSRLSICFNLPIKDGDLSLPKQLFHYLTEIAVNIE